jgi:hypothetical protein
MRIAPKFLTIVAALLKSAATFPVIYYSFCALSLPIDQFRKSGQTHQKP